MRGRELLTQGQRAVAVWLALTITSPLSAAKPKSEPHTIDVGTTRILVMLDKRWKAEADRAREYTVLRYADSPVRENAIATATIGVFRIVVPLAARSANQSDIASAYAVEDISGARKALQSSAEKLVPVASKPEAINGGLLYRFTEQIDALRRRSGSTRFTRASVYFPKSYQENGVVFLVVGGEQFAAGPQNSPEELDKMDELIAGIQ